MHFSMDMRLHKFQAVCLLQNLHQISKHASNFYKHKRVFLSFFSVTTPIQSDILQRMPKKKVNLEVRSAWCCTAWMGEWIWLRLSARNIICLLLYGLSRNKKFSKSIFHYMIKVEQYVISCLYWKYSVRPRIRAWMGEYRIGSLFERLSDVAIDIPLKRNIINW